MGRFVLDGCEVEGVALLRSTDGTAVAFPSGEESAGEFEFGGLAAGEYLLSGVLIPTALTHESWEEKEAGWVSAPERIVTIAECDEVTSHDLDVAVISLIGVIKGCEAQHAEPAEVRIYWNVYEWANERRREWLVAAYGEVCRGPGVIMMKLPGEGMYSFELRRGHTVIARQRIGGVLEDGMIVTMRFGEVSSE